MNRRSFIKWVSVMSLVHSMKISARPVDTGKTPFPELKAKGSFGAIGFAHGKTFASKIDCNVSFYVDWLTNKADKFQPKVSKSQLLEITKRFIPVIAQHQPQQLEEMEGIAKGAKCLLEEIVLLNARTDLAVMVHPIHLC